ncbi:MAG: Stp1/IreP family PP2C-type Ser/Thr phosphatase [Bacilli bacterium]|jgi:serine/threonine protein phosphatase PrpC
MQTYYLTDAGKIRDHNEDSVIIVKNDNDEYLMAVADGMGGHQAGEVASSIVINHISKKFQELTKLGEKAHAVNWLRTNVQIINNEIIKKANNNEDSKGMGSTLVIALLTKDYLLFGNIGDSSGFVMKDQELHKITKDHTLVNLLVSTGELSEEEAKIHPKKNVLMKALGANEEVEMDIFDVDINIEAILLCSDGLTNMLNEKQIEKVLNDERLSVSNKVNRLIKKSNIRGGTDNISVAYLVKEDEEINDN